MTGRALLCVRIGLVLLALALGIWGSVVVYDDVNHTFAGRNDTCVEASKRHARHLGDLLLASITLQWIIAAIFLLVISKFINTFRDCFPKVACCETVCKGILILLWITFVVIIIYTLNKLDTKHCKEFSAAVGIIGIAFPLLICLAILLKTQSGTDTGELLIDNEP